jgi:hypothetical protein
MILNVNRHAKIFSEAMSWIIVAGLVLTFVGFSY